MSKSKKWMEEALKKYSEELSPEAKAKRQRILRDIVFPPEGILTIRNLQTNEERQYTGRYEWLKNTASFLEQGLKELFNVEIVFSEDRITIKASGWEAEIVKKVKEGAQDEG